MFVSWLISLFLMVPIVHEPKLHTEAIDYQDGDVALQGYLAYEEGSAAKRPGVVLIHEWKGHGDYVRRRAEMVAHLGYVAFALDMYGKGVFAKDHVEAGKLSGVYFKDRQLMRQRAIAGLEVLKKQPLCDTTRLAAMGYCFGGTTALEMARAGLDLRAAISFHGNLSAPVRADAKTLKARIIAFHGADDGFISAEVVAGFMEEMRQAKADWQFVAFGGAVHGFTVKEAGNDPSTGMAYNEPADRRSWVMLKNFLEEVFAKP